ncbi:hypothetical protein C8R44DRAFT_865849 [Mycena epipterygia]|nr:hypothetical protein C8R44DRAFT_865849 [Mycena epipterygia]
MPFIDTPPDVLLDITQELDLQDSLRLVATCTTCTFMLRSRCFWIMALHRIEHIHRRPLPCPPGLDISSLPLPTLREMAIHAYKLRQNLSSESPHPTSVHSFDMHDEPMNFVPIQGTRLIMTISRNRLALWETMSGKFISAFEHEVEHARGVSPLFLPGVCLVGIVQARSDNINLELVVVRFDYRNPRAVKVSKIFSQIWKSATEKALLVSDVIVDKNKVVATIIDSDDAASLLFCRFTEGIIYTVPLGSNRDASLPRCIIAGDDFYVTRQYWEPFAEIIHIPASSALDPLNLDQFSLDRVTRAVPSSTTTRLVGTGLGFCNVRFPRYGVLNVTRRTSDLSATDEADVVNSIHFWPAEPQAGVINGVHFWPAEHDGARLTVAPLCFYEHPCKVEAVAVGSSGTWGIVVDLEDRNGLVQYIGGPIPHVTFRRLHIPDVEMEPRLKIALDDRLGILYVANRIGTKGYRLSVVSYA